MKAVALIHAHFEKPGAISTWCEARSIPLVEVHTYRGESLPPHEDFDLLFIMGGPQSVRECDEFPYLRDEILFIQGAIARDKFIFGVCLGAQLIAEALGAATERSPHKEVGVFDVIVTEEGAHDPLLQDAPRSFPVSHWHQDMPGMPVGATILGRSEGCPRQIIRFRTRLLGTQCHFELTPSLIQEMATHCPHDLTPSLYVQDLERFLNHDFDEINMRLFSLLDRFIETA
ncbi:MAG: GMP synthase [Alphaproteobacteria bacterium]|nr:GMP synthase [Alphaproteobacteria bacterium]